MTTEEYNDGDAVVSVTKFRVNLTGCLGQFQNVLKHFENLKNLIPLGLLFPTNQIKLLK